MRSDKSKYEQFIRAEQLNDQQDKHRRRALLEYEGYLFPLEVGIFFKNLFGEEISSFAELFGTMSSLKKEKLKWVDMGGGHGVAQRQFGAQAGGNLVEMTTVELEPLNQKSLPLTKADQNKPIFLVDNIETIELPEPVDLITSVQSIQYLNNPLAALCSWYNQLAVGGLLMVATEHFWSDWVRYENEARNSSSNPFSQILDTFKKHSLSFATIDPLSHDLPGKNLQVNDFRILILVKKAETALALNADVIRIFKNSDFYKAVYYEKLNSIIEVTTAGDRGLEVSERYYQRLNRILLGK